MPTVDQGYRRPSIVYFAFSTGCIKGYNNIKCTNTVDVFFWRSAFDPRRFTCCFSKKWLGVQVVSFRFRFENVINNTTKGSQRESYTVDFYPFL